jgi:phosphatidyl-myo-inositol alpha-mannosyltransferase
MKPSVTADEEIDAAAAANRESDFGVVSTMISRRNLAFSLALLVGLAVVASTPQLAGSHVAAAVSQLDDASAGWLATAAAAFVASALCAASSWRAALAACGGRLAFGDAAARYGVGCLVNSFSPARLGDAVRIGLFSKTLPHRERLWTAGGIWAVVGAARCAGVGAVVLAAAAIGALPLWPVFALAAAVVLMLTLGWATRGRLARGRFTHLLDAVRALEERPALAVRVAGWALAQTGARALAAAAAAAALGAHDPLTAALVIVAALEVSGLLPLTPGNLGITSGAIAIALQAHGIDLTTALSIGIAFHAVETVVGVSCGIAGGLFLVGFPSPAARRYVLAGAGAAAFLGAAFFGLVSFGLV